MTASAAPVPSPVTVEAHLDWAADIARQVAHRYHARGQELADLVSAAHVKLCELVARRAGDGGFNPARAVDADINVSFRVWAYKTVRCTCVRAFQEMRGGGTFRTIRPDRLFKVGVLGDAAGAIVAVDPPEIIEPGDRT